MPIEHEAQWSDAPDDQDDGLEEGEQPPQVDYAEFDFNRPPFGYPTASTDYLAQPLYPQIDETEMLKWEDRIFHPKEAAFIKPPEHLPVGHPVVKAYQNLLKAAEKLTENIDDVKTVASVRSTTRDDTQKALLEEQMPGVANMSKTVTFINLNKRLMWDHLRIKRAYFQHALLYLYLYSYCPDIKENKKEAKTILDQTECVYIGHMVYPLVRSAAHKANARRKSGEIVMNHVYQVCINEVNDYSEEINETKDPNLRRHLFHELKIAMIRSLCHDYLEDFTDLSPEFLANKVAELLNFDTRIESELQREKYEGVPSDTNFFTRNEGRIMQELVALIKPPRGPKREGYQKRQIFLELPRKFRIPTFRTKISDRLNNLKTLAHTEPEGQVNKVLETIDMIDLGLWASLQPKYQNKILQGKLATLCEACLAEANRLLDQETEAVLKMGKKGALEAAQSTLLTRLKKIYALIGKAA